MAPEGGPTVAEGGKRKFSASSFKVRFAYFRSLLVETRVIEMAFPDGARFEQLAGT